MQTTSPFLIASIQKKDKKQITTELCNMSYNHERDTLRIYINNVRIAHELSDHYEPDTLRQYVNKMKDEGRLPQRIITDNPRTHAFLKDFCHSLGIILELKRTRIPELTRLCAYMYEM